MNKLQSTIRQSVQLGRTEQGTTLIEILVSMFILALGIMALVSMQVRTSAGLREAENQSVINQAIQSFAEGMRINPTFLVATSSSKAAAKDYGAYAIAPDGCNGILATIPDTSSADSLISNSSGTSPTTQKTLADYQKAKLCQEISNVPGVTNFQLQVCTNSVIQPKVDVKSVCQAASGGQPGQTIVTAAWQMKSFTDFDKKSGPTKQQTEDSGIDNKGSITYSYQLPLGQ